MNFLVNDLAERVMNGDLWVKSDGVDFRGEVVWQCCLSIVRLPRVDHNATEYGTLERRWRVRLLRFMYPTRSLFHWMSFNMLNWFSMRSLVQRHAVTVACLLFVLTITGVSGCSKEPALSTATDPAADTAMTDTGVVTVEVFGAVDEGDRAKAKFAEDFEVTEGTTLEDVMRRIQQPEIEITGSGVTAFVQSIDGVETNAERGWTFTVDGEFASVGIGSLELTPPQTVRWRYTTFEEAAN
jgi:hypothetical protein